MQSPQDTSAAVSASDLAAMLLSHGGACTATAWWARLSMIVYTANVASALLFAPEGTSSHNGHSRRKNQPALPFDCRRCR